MPQKTAKRGRAPAPISLRLTAEERRQLEQAAAGQTVSSYIRARLFAETPDLGDLREVGRLSVHARQMLLAKILADLGRSKIAASLSDLAEAARIGVLPMTPDTLVDIRNSCRQIRNIRRDLIRALGLRVSDEP